MVKPSEPGEECRLSTNVHPGATDLLFVTVRRGPTIKGAQQPALDSRQNGAVMGVENKGAQQPADSRQFPRGDGPALELPAFGDRIREMEEKRVPLTAPANGRGLDG
jgi:hypothetical protein